MRLYYIVHALMGKKKITEEKFILALWFLSPGEAMLCE